MSFENFDITQDASYIPDIGPENMVVMLYSSVGSTAILYTLLSFFVLYPLSLIRKLRN